MGWHSKGFQVRKNKGVENSPPKTRRPRKTFILERIITPSALVPGGVDDHDALHQLLNSLSLLSFDFSDWAQKFNHASNLHLFADSGAGTCPTSPTPDGDLPPIIDFDPLGLHSPPPPTPGPNIQGAFDTLPPPIILPVDPPGTNNKVPTDLGGAYTFTAKTASGNNDAGSPNQYTFSITNSELNSTASDTVLVGISVESKDGSQLLPELPEVGGLTPILTSSDTNSTYSLFAIKRSGLNLLNLSGASSSTSGAYSLQLNVAGDINGDGRVDATDRQLLDNALGRKVTDPGYTIDLDLNRDGSINSADQTLLNSNFGFIANRPPVASPFSTSTHTELETVIPLVGKASDPEGDSIFYNALNPVNGTVLFNPNTKTATFKPAPGFSGIASFELAASDGLNWGVPAKVTVNVSGAPLLSLDFAQRRPQLYAGESTELTVLGDFADQKGVVLPASYLTYTSLNPGVAPIDAFGKVTGLADGTSILSASRNNLQAVTAARVGELPIPANDDEWNALLAEIYGLDVYPQAVTLTKGVKRSLLVGIEGLTDSPDLKFGSTGTRYFVSNPNVLQVNSDGVITAVGEGIASVTVIDGAAEKVVPVRVKTPLMGPAILGVDGGVVQGSDGSIVMVAPSALTKDTTVNLTPLSSEGLPLSFPDSMEFAGGFNLELGNTPLKIPVQLAIPAPVGVPIGTEVLFMRKGSLPAGADSWNETWLIQESGVVGADGFIRTTSPPFPGVTQSGTYTIGLLPAGMPSVSSIVKAGTKANAGTINLSSNLNFENSYLGAKTSGIGAVAATENQFEATTSLLAYLAQSSNKPLEIIGIPKVGETVVTTAQVQLNTQGVPTVSAVLSGPDTGLAVPLDPPSLESAELEFSNSEPVVFLTGSNFLNGLNGNLGASFGDLKVDFKVSGKSYSGTVVPGLSSSLGENRYKVAVKAPISVPLGESEIVLSRQQKERFGPGPVDSEVVKRSSFEDLQLKPVFSDLILVAQRSSDKIQVIDALSSVQSPSNPQQKPPKDLSVGIPGTAVGTTLDRPGLLAVTSNATRAYVPLERTGRVAMVDLLARRPVDVDASTPAVDDIILPSGASPGAISIDPWDNYAYVADSGRGSIYVLDVNPDSPSYNEVVRTISVNATSGLRQIAVSSDGRKLFATAADGYIYAVNIDPDDKPTVPNSNPRKWGEQIGKVLTPTGAWGLAATPDPLKMVFTNGNPNTDGSGFGVLTVKDDPLNLTPTTVYTNLTLTDNRNVFEVNEGVAVTVTADGKYAFVAGRNSKKIIEVDANPLAGGNIGIIKDPLGPNPQLVAATEPVPGSLTNNVALSSDGKYLIGSYPTLSGGGSAYVFDVEEIIKTVENPAYALTTRAVEKFNPNIIPKGAIPAVIAIGGNPLGLIAAAPDPCFELIKEIVALGNELKKRYDDLRLDDQDLYHRRREISNPPVPRIVPLSGSRTTVTGDPGSWDGHIYQYDKVKARLKELLEQFKNDDDCDDRDVDYYNMLKGFAQAEEYSEKEPPKQPDIKNKSSLLAWANELGAQVRDGALWVGAGVAGVALITLEVIARLLGLELRFRP